MPNEEPTGAQAATSGAQGQEPNAATTPTTQHAAQSQQQSANTTQAASASTDALQPSAAESDLKALVARMEKELADTRKEAASYRTKAKQLDDKIKAEADAQLSDVQKAQQRAEEAEKRIGAFRTRIGSTELKMAAQAAGIIDPDVASALLASQLDYSDDGEPTNVAELVKGLKASKPHLFSSAAQPRSPAPTVGAPANPARSASSNGAISREWLESLTPAQYAALPDARRLEIHQWMAQNTQALRK